MTEVVLVHGLWYRAWSMRVLAGRLSAAGFAVRRFSYPTRKQSFDDSAAALRRFCSGIRGEELHLVGHSLGGLLILSMLASAGDLLPGRVVLLGTPLRGSGVARRSMGLPGGKFFLGAAVDPLRDGWPELPGRRPTGMIAGTRSSGLGRLIGGVQRPNDGTVSVCETDLPGLADRVELGVTHTGMLFSATVADQAAHFLSHGCFEGAETTKSAV